MHLWKPESNILRFQIGLLRLYASKKWSSGNHRWYNSERRWDDKTCWVKIYNKGLRNRILHHCNVYYDVWKLTRDRPSEGAFDARVRGRNVGIDELNTASTRVRWMRERLSLWTRNIVSRARIALPSFGLPL